MAAKPIERAVKRQIQGQGGYDRLIERIASGEPIARLARGFLRPDGVPISRALLSAILHQDPERSERIRAARRDAAHALADHALETTRDASLDRDSIQKAKVIADTDLRLAGLWNREEYGEQKQAIAVQVNVGDLHLNALRHREVLAQPLVVAPSITSESAVGACEAPVSLPLSEPVS